MEFSYILVKGWIISPDVNGFFHCSEEVLVFPCQYTEVFYRHSMTRDGKMVMNWWRGLLVFFISLPKGSSWLTNLFLITLHLIAPKTVYNPTSFQYWISVLGVHQEVLNCMSSFQVHLYTIEDHFLRPGRSHDRSQAKACLTAN